MLISPKEINKILSVTENDVSIRGKKYFEQSRVKVAKFSYNSDVSYKSKTYVTGSMIYEVEIEKKDNYLAFKCDCPVSGKRNTPCKHVIASIFDMYIYPEKYMEFNKKSENLDIDENYAIGKSYKDIQNEIEEEKSREKRKKIVKLLFKITIIIIIFFFSLYFYAKYAATLGLILK